MAVTVIIARLFHLLLKRSSRGRRRCAATLPPGSMGLPLVGETLRFFVQSPSLDLFPFFQRRLEKYGPIFKTNLVGKDLIVSLDPELNNYVFQQEEKAFQIWYPESFMRILGDDNILSSVGSLHKLMRSLVLRVFGPENLRLVLLHDVQSAVKRSLDSWLEKPSIELKAAASSMIFSVTAKWLIGYKASGTSGELWKHYDTQGVVTFPLGIPGTAFYRCMQGRKNVLKVLKQLLDERKKAEPRESKDFFDLVIDELKKEKPLLNEKTALNLLFALLFASFETTSSGITIALKFLADNPKALQELTEEHEQIRKRRADPDAEITWEEYKSMKFTSCVIHESLRLANIAPVLFRKAKQDVHIKGYTIPEGWTVMICPSAVHLNPTTYENPSVFNPWRWKDISKPVGGSKDFIAFGWGLRFCIGADFAKLQMAVFMHYLLTKYRWKVVSGGNIVLSPGLQFPNGFHVQVIPKS
ncbi:hypothetical protein HU200_031493 [Digitaria exilis]|uniref:Cytochrome P450 n=1 Tax=Digitaria exilis TaxID=1010633 RepID=A0A835BPU2_9POAL|nr:hypothetical protein HU200_031493 [Digitaria exilis]